MDSVNPGNSQAVRPGDSHLGPSGMNRMPPPPGAGRRVFWFLFVLAIAALLIGGAWYYQYQFKPSMMACDLAMPARAWSSSLCS